MKREYVIVSNRHQSRFPGCMLFWGHHTEDDEKRSFGGYTSGLDKCERYTLEDIHKNGLKFPLYNGEDEYEFNKIDDVIVKIDDLLACDWLKTMTVVYRP